MAHGRVLTTCVRVDRFSEGDLADAFEAGLIGRAVLRAGQLLAALEAQLGPQPWPGRAWDGLGGPSPHCPRSPRLPP